MALSLRQKVNFTILATFAFIALIFTAAQISLQQHQMKFETDSVKLLLQAIVERDKEEFANEIFDNRVKALQIRIKQISNVDGIIYTGIFNNSGKLLASHGERALEQSPVLEFPDKIAEYTQAKILSGKDGKMLFFSSPLGFLGENTGFILIYYSLEKLIKNQQVSVLIYVGLMFSTLVCMLFLLNIILGRTVHEPIKRLVDSSKAIVKGDYENTFYTEQADEIGELSKSFDLMRRAVKEKIRDIDQMKERYRLLYQQAPAMLCSVDSHSRIVEVNNLLLKTIGRSRENLLGSRSFDFFSSDAVDILGFLKETLKGKSSVKSKHYQIKSHDGSILDTLVSIFAQKDSEENIIQATFSILDITEQKQLEASLRRTQFIFDKAPIGIWRMGRFGEILDVNEKGCASLGYTREELCRMSVFDLDPEMDKDRWEKSRALLEKTGFTTIDSMHQGRNGKFFPIEVVQKIVKFEEEDFHVAFVQDITERKQNEASLREKDKLLYDIGKLTQIGAWKFDLQTGRATSTDEVSRIYEFDETEDIKVERGLSCFHGIYREKIEHAFKEAVEKGTPYDLELEMISAKGHRKWVRTICAPVMKDGQVILVQGSFQDITEHKRMEQALEQSEKRLVLALEGANQGIWDLDLNEDVAYLDSRIYILAGYEPDEFPSTRDELSKRIHKDDLEYVGSTFRRYLAGELKNYEVQFRFLRKDGTYMWVLSVGKIVEYDALGNPTRFIGINADITDKKQIEQEKENLQYQLIQAQKMESIGRLAGGIAHDLNNLLVPILGYTEMLMEDIIGEASRQEKLKAVYKAGDGARNLVRQLLAFSRRQTLEFGLVDIDKILQDFRPLLRRTIREDIQLDILSSSGAKVIRADRTQIEQIIMNLSVNAADAMTYGGVLTIETDNVDLDEAYAAQHPGVIAGPYVFISFTDTGHGMDKETCDRIFEPFFSTKGTDKGTGLGLATVYGIVKQHKGNIWVYSEIDKGSVFKVYLPHVRGKKSESIIKKETIQNLKGSEKILLAEDNEGVRNLAAEILTKNGYTVFAAENGNNALEMWASIDEPVDLLITDVIMPGMNGNELFEALHSLDPDIRVIYMSGYPDNAIAHHGVLDQDARYIQKPFNSDDFLYRIRQVLDQN